MNKTTLSPALRIDKVLSLQLGTHKSVAEYRDAFAKKNIPIGSKADEMISRPSFSLLGEKKLIKIGFVTVLSLLPDSIHPITNYWGGGTRREIDEAREKNGLMHLPKDAIFEIPLQYGEGEIGRPDLGVEPMAEPDQSGFYIFRLGGDKQNAIYGLHGSFGCPHVKTAGSVIFIYQLPE